MGDDTSGRGNGVSRLSLSPEARLVTAIILLATPAIMLGGLSLLGILSKGMAGQVIVPLEPDGMQWALGRAGHAHAGVWVILSLVIQVLLDAARLPRGLMWVARLSPPGGAAALSSGLLGLAFVPAARWLVYLGAASMALGLVLTAIGLWRNRPPGEARPSIR